MYTVHLLLATAVKINNALCVYLGKNLFLTKNVKSLHKDEKTLTNRSNRFNVHTHSESGLLRFGENKKLIHSLTITRKSKISLKHS